jgi:hypothetical protein
MRKWLTMQIRNAALSCLRESSRRSMRTERGYHKVFLATLVPGIAAAVISSLGILQQLLNKALPARLCEV